jgi:hypothetical protein
MAVCLRHALRLVTATGVVAAVIAAPTLGGSRSVGEHIATCPPGEVANPAGYGCVPYLAPGGAVVGAPTEEELSACHGGSLYFCVDPYRIP